AHLGALRLRGGPAVVRDEGNLVRRDDLVATRRGSGLAARVGGMVELRRDLGHGLGRHVLGGTVLLEHGASLVDRAGCPCPGAGRQRGRCRMSKASAHAAMSAGSAGDASVWPAAAAT